MVKRSLSVILAVIMLFGVINVFPMSAFAQEAEIADEGADVDLAETGNPYENYKYAKDPEGNWANCTYWAWQYAYEYDGIALDAWGDGRDWYSGASGTYPCDKTPSAHSIMCTGNGYYGHVAYVTDYDSANGKVYIKQGGVRNTSDGRGEWWTSAYPSDLQGYIHLGVSVPSNAWISASHRALPIGWDISFTFGADNATNFWIGIDRNGSRIITEEVSSGKSYHFTETGSYSAYVTAGNSAGSVDSNRVEFTVYQARNIGEKFTAAILHTKSGVAVTADDSGNVVVKQYKGTDDQLWLFEREGEYKRYKISNVKTGKCLDVYNGGTVDDTNIQVWSDNGATAQRWYLRPNSSGYSLAPMCASHGSIDMVGGNSSDGNNIAMWYCVEGNSNQIFTLQILDAPAYTATFNGHKYELYNTSVAWKEAFQYCEQQGGHLVTINSQNEQDFINGLISNSAYPRIWAGGMDGYTEGRWQWITGESFSYSNWGSDEPNNSGDEDYLMLSKSDGAWNDVADVFNNTENGYSFICEYDDVIDSTRTKLEKGFDYNNHRYEIYSGSLDWLSAKQFCEQKGGHLVTITTTGENSTIVNNVKTLKHEAYWLGLTDVEHESKWHWITDEAYTYKNWNNSEPNNYGGIEDYAVYVTASEKWNDLSGRAVLNTDIGFICEYDYIPILGDANGDEDVDTVDVTLVQRYLADMDTGFTEAELMRADVDGSGELEITDATLIQRYLADMRTGYPIGEYSSV